MEVSLATNSPVLELPSVLNLLLNSELHDNVTALNRLCGNAKFIY